MTTKQKFYPVGNQRFSFRAFTLIELLVVIAIIGLLSSIVLVSTKEATEKARMAKLLNLSSQIHHALGAYSRGLWDFYEGSGSSVGDISGYGNNATITGTGPQWTTDTPNGQGFALDADGASGNKVETTKNIGITGSTPRTITFWIKPDDTDKPQMIFMYGQCSAGNKNCIGIQFDNDTPSNPDGLYVYLWSTGPGQFGTPPYSITRNKWNFVVYTYDGTTQRLYVNGILKGSRSATLTTVDSTGRIASYCGDIGCSSTCGQDGFYGLIDEVRIYEESITIP